LNPASVTDGIARVRPWAVDVSTGVEVGKGLKDPELMRRFCDAVREADARLADRS
jgi:phosphoribosylanthranilate isomerase